jgi:Domain of unknown function (DUF4082)
VGEQSSVRQEGPGAGQALSRRRIFKRAAGLAALGAAGGSVLSQAAAEPARAAVAARQVSGLAGQQAAVAGTTVQQGAVAPAVVPLADAGTIAVDASLGNDFRVTIGGDRTMGNPTNPTDGQKITFQITQGSAGSATITWGSAYAFGTGLPQPTLSTQAGQTDLLAFVYNADKAKWLLAAYVLGFSPTAVTQPKGTYRLFPSTNGPSSPVSYSGPFTCGVVFTVTEGGCWLDGFWWWVCDSGQSTAAQKFALWCVYGPGYSGSLVAAATFTSGALTAGQWNFVKLPAPVPLAVGATYVAATGFNGSFPDTNNQFGSGGAYSAGVVNGPLTAYSDASGSKPSPFNGAQGVFTVATADPTASMPIYGSNACNFWMDLQVDTNPPTGASYRLWPSYPTLPGHLDSDTTGYTLATEFQLSASCQLNKIWFYSASGAGALPTRCAIWDVSSQTVVAATDNTSPSWSGAAGSGWVSCGYSGITLPAGDYKVAVYYGGGSEWYQATTGYWNNGGAGTSGITAGPVTAPSSSAATGPGQGTYHQGSWAYPQSYSSDNGENYWVDAEVTPA